jgi:hypothetical protein
MHPIELSKQDAYSQRAAVFASLWDRSRPWESLDRAYKEELDVGWTTRIGHGSEVLEATKDRLENLFQDLVWVSKLGFYLSTGYSPGLLLAFSLDIIP